MRFCSLLRSSTKKSLPFFMIPADRDSSEGLYVAGEFVSERKAHRAAIAELATDGRACFRCPGRLVARCCARCCFVARVGARCGAGGLLELSECEVEQIGDLGREIDEGGVGVVVDTDRGGDVVEPVECLCGVKCTGQVDRNLWKIVIELIAVVVDTMAHETRIGLRHAAEIVAELDERHFLLLRRESMVGENLGNVVPARTVSMLKSSSGGVLA